MNGADPFGTERLRAAVLAAWRDSPTRFTEDANAERDLRVGAYRDRLFVELAQNAADAAQAAGVPGRIRVSVVDGELRFANTGAPLDARGVESLASLRASGKDRLGAVGRFGIGFAAVRTVTDEPRVVSTTGGVGFSARRTREESGRDGDVPVLRLPFPVEEEPPAGYDTEIRLPLREPAPALLDELAGEIGDLLLALPWLAEAEVDGRVWTRSGAETVRISGPQGAEHWLTHGPWAVPVDDDGIPLPRAEDVLHAPTPTDEGLSLPARLIAAVPLEPSRRRVLPGPELDEALRTAAGEYVGLVRAVAPERRFTLVPAAGFPRSTVDAELGELVVAKLAEESWLTTVDGELVSGRQARMLDVDLPGLPGLLADVVPGLVAAPPSVLRLLKPISVQAWGISDALELLTGIDREPEWWRKVYAVLAEGVESHALAPAQLEGLPVPLSDGRTLPGVRGALLVEGSGELLELMSDVDVPGLRLVHPDAAHPLLERLGAKHADAKQLLESEQLKYAVENSVADVRSGLDGIVLAGAVLRLIADSGDQAPSWAGALALPTEDGWRRADEVVLPASPLLDVFDPEVFESEGALSVLDEEFAGDWPSGTLVATGVLDSFAVVGDEEPHEPDHDLPDEDLWWEAAEPATVVAVRDLDLVADDAWPAALRLLAARPETWQALHTPDGHAAWWLARYALLAGEPPSAWRMPSATGLTGLYDVVPDLGLTDDLLLVTGVRTGLELATPEDVTDLLDRLGDPARTLAPGLIARAHAALAAAPVDVAELDAPARVRAADGTVTEDAVVLDAPWFAAALEPGRMVVAPQDPERLAELLDLPLASGLPAEVTSEGEYVAWADLPALGLVADLLGLPLPDGGLILHDPLTVTVDGVRHEVPWWSDDRLHAADTSEGLARAFASATGRWADRYRITALLEDPAPHTLLN
ncbi:sacsin N-terminal ATP-binding-like domain-containing protein [Amycolatopsis panacis]|uniref:Molecular chaperone Hsp90 n=1 Tax=Amycolatopsis panacis TaxID=2340917 RepID=A0A419I6R7_9PSEU|nr:molecular chaperone Hsp90 [Amycolatopsis panacis]RJQ87030.1 molecular chaperone Hsp90 [Amycolatopsis panacis]